MARILYFTRDYTTHDHRFLAALAETEHKVYYLRLERRGLQLEDRPLPPQIEQLTWRGGRGPVSLKDAPQLLADLNRILASLKPDLIHAGPIQTSALLAALTGFRPLVSMSWGSDLLMEADRNGWFRWATRYTLYRSAALVGDCNPVRQKAIAFGMPDERIVTFPWGVDLRHYSPTGPGLPIPGYTPSTPEASSLPPSFVILSTRSWEPVYGVDVIARAFVLAAQHCPELRLLMLGGGSQAPLLRQIFTQGDVLERVHFPGQVTQSSLPRYYRAANLYVSASHSDGSSISLLEAMACGRPALVSDIPGNREWVTPGEQGWWFPDGDAGALAQAILHAVQERKRLPAMGRVARLLTEQRADWEQNFQHLMHAYAIALNGKHSTGSL